MLIKYLFGDSVYSNRYTRLGDRTIRAFVLVNKSVGSRGRVKLETGKKMAPYYSPLDARHLRDVTTKPGWPGVIIRC